MPNHGAKRHEGRHEDGMGRCSEAMEPAGEARE